MSSSVVNSVEELARPIVEAKQAFIVDVRLRGERGGKVVEIFIDADTGVTTDLCADVSRELSRELDTAGVIHGRFHLVVSSPGLERPLKFHRQYAHHVGRMLNVTYKLNGQIQNTEGELIQTIPDGIELRLRDNSVVPLSFQDIIEARVVAAW